MSNSLQPTDCSPPGFSVHRILQARILEWVAIFSSRGSSLPRDWIRISSVSCIAGGFFTSWAMWEAPIWPTIAKQMLNHGYITLAFKGLFIKWPQSTHPTNSSLIFQNRSEIHLKLLISRIIRQEICTASAHWLHGNLLQSSTQEHTASVIRDVEKL